MMTSLLCALAAMAGGGLVAPLRQLTQPLQDRVAEEAGQGYGQHRETTPSQAPEKLKHVKDIYFFLHFVLLKE